MSGLKIFRSWFSYYLYPCISDSWIWLWSHMSTLMCCGLCLFYLIASGMIVIFRRSINSKRFFPSILSWIMTWASSILSFNKLILFNLLNLWTLGRDYNVSWFFIRTWWFNRLVIGTHITSIPSWERSWLVLLDSSLVNCFHSLVI